MFGNLLNRLKSMTSSQRTAMGAEYGKEGLKRKATRDIRSDIKRKQGEAESKIRGNMP